MAECNPSVNDPPPHCPVLLVTPAPTGHKPPSPGADNWPPHPVPVITPPPTDARDSGLVVPVDDGAILIPAAFLFLGAVALAMRWIERVAR